MTPPTSVHHGAVAATLDALSPRHVRQVKSTGIGLFAKTPSHNEWDHTMHFTHGAMRFAFWLRSGAVSPQQRQSAAA